VTQPAAGDLRHDVGVADVVMSTLNGKLRGTPDSL
jgi:hypothetical protein